MNTMNQTPVSTNKYSDSEWGESINIVQRASDESPLKLFTEPSEVSQLELLRQPSEVSLEFKEPNVVDPLALGFYPKKRFLFLRIAWIDRKMNKAILQETSANRKFITEIRHKDSQNYEEKKTWKLSENWQSRWENS